MRRVLGDFGRKRSGGGSTNSGGPPYKKPASTKQRAGNREHAVSEQAASEHAAPSTEQEREASSEKRPGTACEQGQRETKRQRETKWREWLLPTREQELANRLGIDSCFKCKGKEWELVKSCDDCGELICADCDNNYGGIGIPTWCGMGKCSGTLTLPPKMSERNAACISLLSCCAFHACSSCMHVMAFLF